MAHYKMQYFGRAMGDVTKIKYSFAKGQIIEAPKGEFSPDIGEDVSEDFKGEKKTVEVAGKEAETATRNPKGEKRKSKA